MHAGVIDWGDTGTTWATGGNWIGGAAPTDDLTTDIARFNDTVYSFQPQISGTRQVAGIQFGDGVTATGNVTVTGTATPLLVIGSSGITLAAGSGTATFSTAPLRLGASQSWANNSSSLLTVSSTVSNFGDVSPFTLTFSDSGSGGTTISGIVSNGGATGTTALNVATTGGVTMLSNGGNTFTGGITLSQGILRASQSGATGTVLGAGGTLTLAGGELQLVRGGNTNASNFARDTVVTGNAQIASDVGSGSIGVTHTLGALSIGGQTLTITPGAAVATGTAGVTFGATTLTGNATFSTSPNTRLNLGAMTDGAGTFGFTKNGAGVLNLTAAGTMDGAISISQGTVMASNADALGTGTVSIGTTGGSDAATLQMAFSGTSTGGTIQVASGAGARSLNLERSGSNASQVTTNAIVLSNDLTINANLTGTNFSGAVRGGISGTGNVAINNSGNTLTFDTTNLTYTGSLRNSGSGTVTIGSGIASSVTEITHDGTGTLVLGSANAGFAGTVTVNAGTVRVANAGALTSANTLAVGSAGTFDLKQLNTLTYDQTVAGLNNGIGGGGTVTNSGGTQRTLTLGGAGNYTFAGTVTATTPANMNIAKTGSGTQIFTGNNTYGGTTTISGGKLVINGAHTGAGTYLVNSGGTLGGIGSITGALNSNITVATGGKLAPGASAGTLTADLSGTGTLNISAAVGGSNVGALEFELGANGLGTSDRFVLSNGTLAIGSGSLEFSDFNFILLSGFGGGTYTLFDTNSAISGSLGSSLTGTLGGYNATLSLSGNDVVLTVVPEPSVSVTLLGGIGMLLAFGRGRRVARFGKI